MARIKDTGVGIASDEIGKLFEKCKQTTTWASTIILQMTKPNPVPLCSEAAEKFGPRVKKARVPGLHSRYQ